MWKWLVYSVLLVVVLVFSATAYVVFNDELNTRLSQYIQLNKGKNWGLRKQAMHIAESLLSLSPSHGPATVSMDKSAIEAGAKPERSAIDSLIASATRLHRVDNSRALLNRLKRAQPGDVILLAPGQYPLRERFRVKLARNPSNAAPVVIAAEQLDSVELQLWSIEGFYVDSPNWQFHNLVFRGMCDIHGRCQHAIHLYGDADNVLVRNNRFIDFNAAIKANGDYSAKPAKFADGARLLHNDFYNTSVRKTDSPASPIDVVGGNDWQVKGNFIADFSRKLKGKASVVYGAFLKGGGNNGLFEDNVINCAWRIPHQSALDVRLGLSLGDGGTGKQFCQVQDCAYEHANGVIRNNIILNCHNDVAIYLNKAKNTRIENNILLSSLGIDARFPASTVVLSGNNIEGRVKARDGAKVTHVQND